MAEVEEYASKYINSLSPSDLVILLKEDREAIQYVNDLTDTQAKTLINIDSSLIEYLHSHLTDIELMNFISKFDNENDEHDIIWWLYRDRVCNFEKDYVYWYVKKFYKELTSTDIVQFYDAYPEFEVTRDIQLYFIENDNLHYYQTPIIDAIVKTCNEEGINFFIDNYAENSISINSFGLMNFLCNEGIKSLLDVNILKNIYEKSLFEPKIVDFALKNGMIEFLKEIDKVDFIYQLSFGKYIDEVDVTKLGDIVDMDKFLEVHNEYIFLNETKKYKVSFLKLLIIKLRRMFR